MQTQSLTFIDREISTVKSEAKNAVLPYYEAEGGNGEGRKFNFIKCKLEGPGLLSEGCFYDYYRKTSFHILLSAGRKAFAGFDIRHLGPN